MSTDTPNSRAKKLAGLNRKLKGKKITAVPENFRTTLSRPITKRSAVVTTEVPNAKRP